MPKTAVRRLLIPQSPELLRLEAISFRAGDPLPSAPLPLRIDAFSNVPLPEWQRGRNQTAQDSPVLFVKRALGTGAVSILGKFTVKSGGVFLLKAKAKRGGIFDDVAEFRVDFRQAGEQFISIPIQVRDLPEGVDARDQEWLWSFRLSDSEKWARLEQTKHRIFVILDLPGSPWMASRHNSLAWPWATALEKVCEWAQGAITPDDATAKIVSKLLAKSKGPNRWFIYQLKKTFNYFVEHGYLQLQQALATIEGDPLAFHNVNCVDAASLVATFANLVGGRIRETVIDRPNGRLFPTRLLPLGSSDPQVLKGNGFDFHEIALSNGGDVWDICFRLKAGSHFVPSIKVPFTEYTGRLLGADAGELERLPRSRNFTISPGPLAVSNYFSGGEVKERFQSAASPDGPRGFIYGLFFKGDEIPGWRMVQPKTRLFPTRSAADMESQGCENDPFVRYLDTIWRRKGSSEVVRVATYVAPTRRFAESLAVRRGEEIGEDLKPKTTKPPNEVSFIYQEGKRSVTAPMKVFANVMCFPRRVSAHKGSVSYFDAALSDLLLTQPPGLKPVRKVSVRASDIRFNGLVSAEHWWKFFCPTGWLHSEAGKLVFDPGKSKTNPTSESTSIMAYAMSGKRVVEALILNVRNDTE